MVVDWELAIRIGVPVATALVAAIVNRALQERPKLIKYVSHASGFEWSRNWELLRIPGEEPAALAATASAQATDAGGDSPQPAAMDESAKPAAAVPAPSNKVWANAHSVLIRNIGRKTATNVRIGHNARPYTFQIYPHVSYELLKGQGNAWEILVPALVPGESLQVAYLYDPRVLWSQIDSYVKSDECMAITQNVAPVPLDSWPKWYARHATYYLGIAAAAYLLVRAGEWIYRVNTCVGTCG
jgi:hypothetical protein